MTKTCFFCELFDECEVYSDSEACDTFQPDTDWLEYEELKKENEELKKIKDAYEGKAQKTFKVGDIIIPNDWATGKTNDGKTYFFELNNGQKVVGKKHNQTRVGGFCYDFVITEIESEVKVYGDGHGGLDFEEYDESEFHDDYTCPECCEEIPWTTYELSVELLKDGELKNE